MYSELDPIQESDTSTLPDERKFAVGTHFGQRLNLNLGVVVVLGCLGILASQENGFWASWAATTLATVLYSCANAIFGIQQSRQILALYERYSLGPLLRTRSGAWNGLAHGIYFSWGLASLGGLIVATACTLPGFGRPIELAHLVLTFGRVYGMVFGLAICAGLGEHPDAAFYVRNRVATIGLTLALLSNALLFVVLRLFSAS
jgi:hypothetical protein